MIIKKIKNTNTHLYNIYIYIYMYINFQFNYLISTLVIILLISCKFCEKVHLYFMVHIIIIMLIVYICKCIEAPN